MGNPETQRPPHPLQPAANAQFIERAGGITKWYASPVIGARKRRDIESGNDQTNLNVSFLDAEPEHQSALDDISKLFRNRDNIIGAIDRNLYTINAPSFPTLTFITPHDSLLDIVIPMHAVPSTKYFNQHIHDVRNQYLWLGRMLTYVGYGMSRTNLVRDMILPKANAPLVIPRTASTEQLYANHGQQIDRLNRNAMTAQRRHANAHPVGQKIHYMAPSGSEMKKDGPNKAKTLGTISENTFTLLHLLSDTGPIIVVGCGLNISHVALASKRLALRPNLRFAMSNILPDPNRSEEQFSREVINTLLSVAQQTGGESIIAGYRMPDGSIASHI